MIGVLGGFVQELRRAGLPVSLTENLDAAEAVTHVALEDREALKAALGATLVKNEGHRATFETVFDIYFALRTRLPGDDEMGTERPVLEAEPAAGGPGDLAERFYRALHDDDGTAMRALAREAVDRYAGMEMGRPVGGTYHLYRSLRRMELEGLLDRLMQAAQDDSDARLTPLEERLLRDEYNRRVDALRSEIEAEIRRRMVAERGVEAVARALRRPLPEEVDFMHATREELVVLRRTIYPLTRRLAVRLARRRRHRRRGPLDFRSTVRHSLSYGGVPAEPRFRHHMPSKPEIVVIADVSGSVAAFARFTLQFVYAMGAQFSKVRSFVFIDGVDEVTRFLDGADDIGAALARINREADVVRADGHSDYGHAFEEFWECWPEAITAKSSVILLGDARNNYHESGAWVVREMGRAARHLFWLNPEPRAYWDTGDSIVSQYGAHCDGVFECRNLRQLEHFVEQMA